MQEPTLQQKFKQVLSNTSLTGAAMKIICWSKGINMNQNFVEAINQTPTMLPATQLNLALNLVNRMSKIPALSPVTFQEKVTTELTVVFMHVIQTTGPTPNY